MLRIVLTLALFAAAPRHDIWRIVGPGGGGAQFYPSVSPHDPKLVLAACDMTGSYISRDGGESWRMFNLRGVSRQFGFDPVDAKTLYAMTSVLWRSTDSGSTWRLVWPDASRITGSDMSDDHAGERLLVDGVPAGRLRAFAIHPTDRKQLYLAVQDELLVSADGGTSWKSAGTMPFGARRLWAGASGQLYAAGEDAIYRREANEWHKGASMPGMTDVSAGWKDGRLIVYAVSSSGGQVSEDGGASWRPFALAGKGARLRAIATSAGHPDTAYVSYGGLDGGYFGVAKTTDRGKTWSLPWRESRSEKASNLATAWLEEKFGSGWASNPLSMGVSPTDPDLAFGTDFGRTVRTTDGGKTWKAVYSKQMDSGYISTGLDVTTAYGVHFDPFDPKRMFITYTDIGAFRSEDGGKTWLPSTTGIERPWTNTTYWLAFDPEVRGRVWGAFSGTHDLPRPKMWRTQSTSRYRGGVGISEDSGRTWKMITGAGMPETAATDILLDPRSPKERRTLYVAGFGRGVYKSADGGASWTLKNKGLPESEPFAWRFARRNDGGLYLVMARRTEDESFGGPGDGALFFSSDDAENWTRVSLPEGVNGPNGLALHPRKQERMYLAVWGRRGASDRKTGGIFRTDDSGKTWKQVLARDQHIYDVTIDTNNPNVVYACGFESSAWRSSDGGDTWERIRGYNFKWGHRVIPDPADRSKIYITTYGGSVWHGPAVGDPHAKEDIEGAWLAKIR